MLKISENEAAGILKVASGRSGLDKIDSGGGAIMNGKSNFRLFMCWYLHFGIRNGPLKLCLNFWNVASLRRRKVYDVAVYWSLLSLVVLGHH